MRSVSVSVAASRFLVAVEPEVSPATHALYSLYVLKFAKQFGRRRLDSITPAELRLWGKSYHRVQAVQRMFSWCHHEARLISSNPIEGMRKMSRGRRLRVVDRLLSSRLQRRATKAFRRLLVALECTIARPGELRRARWQDVRVAGLGDASDADLSAGVAFLFFDQFKASSLRRDRFAVRIVPIPARLGRLLVRLRRLGVAQDGHIFLNRNRRPWTVNAVRCAMRSLRKKLGIARDHRGENVVAYSMRHSGATAAVVAGVPLAELAQVMGHSDVRQTNRYVHLSPVFLAMVIQRIEAAKAASKEKNRRPGSTRTRPDDVQ